MPERKLKEWEKNIKVLLGDVPQLNALIKNPVYYSHAPWAGEVNRYFLRSTNGSEGENFYRVVFKQGSPKSLMTIGSGELAGLKTTSVVEKGRIAAAAGLERVDVPAAPNLLPLLLTIGMFGAIQNRLNFISNVCVDIRNRQIVGDNAKLERISEVILECFESIPEMDQEMMRINLARIVNNTDECHELLIIMREELKRECEANYIPFSTTDWQDLPVKISNEQYCSYYNPRSFIFHMMQHKVFAAYERFVAGKICQIVLSGNYSISNIERSKQSVFRVKESILEIFSARIRAHNNGVDEFRKRLADLENSYRNGYEWQNRAPNDTYSNLELSIEKQLKTIKDIEEQLYDLLDAKLESFDFLSKLTNYDEIEVYLINGAIVINENEAQSVPNLQEPFSDRK